MFRLLDDILNKITTYRLVLYVLLALNAWGIALAAMGLVPYSPAATVFNACFITGISLAANRIFAWAFEAPVASDSVYITAGILTLLISPITAATSATYFPLAIGATLIAIGSKFVFAYRKRHIFNPAALGVAAADIFFGVSASWWIATLWMLPMVLVGGLIVVRKIDRTDVVASFLLITAAASLTPALLSGTFASVAWNVFAQSPILFFAFVMLTEPVTMPPTRRLRLWYAALVGIVTVPWVHVGSFYFTPEIALLLGNLFAFVVSPKGRFVLTLRRKISIARDTVEFVFTPDRRLAFTPGQYMEWTVVGARSDSRGNRRYFTLVSAPAENDVAIGVKLMRPPSAFKESLQALEPGDTVMASSPAGDFTLPHDTEQKIAFIAGGIGITPFISMLRHLMLANYHRDAVLLYANRNFADVAYQESLAAAEEYGIRTVYITEDGAPGHVRGRLDEGTIMREVPDYLERTFYISGPRSLVTRFKAALRMAGVKRRNIKIDYFPGFA